MNENKKEFEQEMPPDSSSVETGMSASAPDEKDTSEAPTASAPSEKATSQDDQAQPGVEPVINDVAPPPVASDQEPLNPMPPEQATPTPSSDASSTQPAQAAQQPPPRMYHWTYADQQAHDAQNEQKKRSKGLLLYVLILTGVFVISFGLLLGVMMMKGEKLPSVQFNENGSNGQGNVIQNTDMSDAIAIEKSKHFVVLIEASSATKKGIGTGIILSSDGYIATNHHVIDGATSIRVKFYDGTYATATVRGSSALDDLAVIKVDRWGLTPATFASSSECFVGQTVYAIGHPSGSEMAWTTTKGCISYVNRELKIYDKEGTLEKKLKMLQTDTMVNPGNSGGPLINTRGEVVGIVSLKLSDGYEGIGFAIPSDGAAEILNAIIQDGNANNVDSNVSYQRPLIGINGLYLQGGKHYVFDENLVSEATDSYAAEHPDEVYTAPVSGIYVSSLLEGTDASTKLAVGDIITAVNGIEITSMAALPNEINKYYAGDEVQITYYRNGLYNETTIILSAQSD